MRGPCPLGISPKKSPKPVARGHCNALRGVSVGWMLSSLSPPWVRCDPTPLCNTFPCWRQTNQSWEQGHSHCPMASQCCPHQHNPILTKEQRCPAWQRTPAVPRCVPCPFPRGMTLARVGTSHSPEHPLVGSTARLTQLGRVTIPDSSQLSSPAHSRGHFFPLELHGSCILVHPGRTHGQEWKPSPSPQQCLVHVAMAGGSKK